MVVRMKKERGSVKKYYPQIEEMHLQGMSAQEIGDILGLEKASIHNAISNMGLSQKRNGIDETTLVYADNKIPVLEKEVVYGKWFVKDGIKQRINHFYTDMTPLFSPR